LTDHNLKVLLAWLGDQFDQILSKGDPTKPFFIKTLSNKRWDEMEQSTPSISGFNSTELDKQAQFPWHQFARILTRTTDSLQFYLAHNGFSIFSLFISKIHAGL
jgi:hypothetical protein